MLKWGEMGEGDASDYGSASRRIVVNPFCLGMTWKDNPLVVVGAAGEFEGEVLGGVPGEGDVVRVRDTETPDARGE